MSEENLEIVRRGYEAFARGDITAMFAALDPEIVTYTAPPLLPPGEHVGLDGVLEWIGDWTEAFGEFTLTPEEYLAKGEFVLVRARQVATGASSGVLLEREFWFVHRMREGSIVRMGVHPNRESAEEAAGISA